MKTHCKKEGLKNLKDVGWWINIDPINKGAPEDWRDVRAVLIYREKDLGECSKGRRSLLRRRIGAHVGTKEEFCKLMHLWFHEEGVYLAKEFVQVGMAWSQRILNSIKTRGGRIH